MRLTSVDLSILEIPTRFQMPLQYPFHRLVVADLQTDEGIQGLGYCLIFGGAGGESVYACLETRLKPLLVGRDPTDTEKLWHEMAALPPDLADRRALAYATATLDIGLWDIVGKVAGRPLGLHWGAESGIVRCYGSGGWSTYDTSDLVAEAERYASVGCSYYKLKIHDQDPAVNRRRVEAVARAVGPEVRLMVDVNQRGNVESNRRQASLLEDLDLVWYEEPVPAADIAVCAQVARSIAIPVATGENNLTLEEFQEIVTLEAAQFLNPDVCRARGFTELLRIGRIAEEAGVGVAPHLVPELSVHVAAALSTGVLVEYMDWLPEDVFEDPPQCVAGSFAFPDAPGHGLRITRRARTKYRVK